MKLTPENDKELDEITGPGVPATDATPPESPSQSNETPDNNPDDPNSTAPLPEDPAAQSIDEVQPGAAPPEPPPADLPSIAGAPPVGAMPDGGEAQPPPVIPYPKAEPITFQGAANTVNRAANAGIDAANTQARVPRAEAADREAKAEGFDQRAVEAMDSRAQREQLQEEANQARKSANEHYDAIQKKIENFQFHNYWEEKSTGQRILAGISVFLGGLTRSADAKNSTLEAINNAIDKDYSRQKEKLLQLKDAGERARQAGLDANSWYKEQLAELGIQQGFSKDATAAQAEAHILRNGGNAQDAQSNVLVQTLRQKAEEDRAKGYIDLEKAKLNAEAMKARTAAAGGGSLNVVAIVDELRRGGATPGQIARDPRLATANPKDVMSAIKGSDSAQGSEKSVSGDVTKEMAARMKELNDPKNGVGTKFKQVDEALKAVDYNPGNPVVWTNMIDGMIRSNTGRAAILSQYKLYTGKAANSFDIALSALNQAAGDGTLGDKVKANLKAAAEASRTEYQGAIGKLENNVRGTYEKDARVVNNPRSQSAYRANHMQFQPFPGGESIGGGAPAAPAAPSGPVKTATGPNGQKLKLEGGKWLPM